MSTDPNIEEEISRLAEEDQLQNGLTVKRNIDIDKPNWNIIDSSTLSSPRKSVTKVTKLILNSSTSTNHNGSAKHEGELKRDQNLPMVDSTKNLVKIEEFKIKKQDRDKLNNEFTEFLVTNFNNVNNLNASSINNKNNNQKSITAKSMTPAALTSKKINPPNDIKVVSSCKKNKNYNPEEAREYIKVQQKKRKMSNDQTKVENKFEKEEIQKRLKDLQERTAKIVQTNLQKSKIRSRSLDKPHNSLGILRRLDSTPNKPDKNVLPSGTIASNAETIMNNKNHNKSSINSTSKTSISTPSDSRAALLNQSRISDKVETPHPIVNAEYINIENVSEVDDLKVPDINLNPSHNKPEATSQLSDISFWLRPSGVQVYPYNFIMAIRKKLEAISEPKINNDKYKASIESNNNKISSQSNESSNTVSDISSIRSEPIKKQNIFTSTHIEDKNNEYGTNSSVSEEILELIPLSQEKIQGMKISAKENSNKKDLSNAEFYKLLESFNKSLSHVIQVNQQLYSSLKNPPECLVNFNRGNGSVNLQNAQISLKTDESKKTEIEYSENFDQIQATIGRHDDIEETTIVPILNLNSSSRISASNSDHTTTLKTFTENNNKNHNITADINNTTLGSEIFSYFKDLNDTDLENSLINYSEINLNYSKIGIYDKMIKHEQTKSEHLASLMKLREKSLIDRARGQIAWLEIQKQKFKEAGKRTEISSIKKKQRALLMRLDKERANIHKIFKEKELSQNEKSSVVSLKYKELHSSSSSISIRKQSKSISSNDNSALKVYDLEGGTNLSNLLQQREIELKKRRDNVEKLLEWHRRLDIEEQHVVEMERQLYEFNLNKISNHQIAINVSNNVSANNNNKKIKKINRSLKILKNIPSSKGNTSTSDEVPNDKSDNVVDIVGAKLNKLWYRLTGRKDHKYDENHIYNITKTELEEMYIEAKRVVMEENQILKLIDTSQLDMSRGTNTEIDTEPDMQIEEDETGHEVTSKSEVHAIPISIPELEIDTSNNVETHIQIEGNTTIDQPSNEIKDSKDTTYTVMHDLEIFNSETDSEPTESVLNILPPELNTTIPSFLDDVSFPNFNDISSTIINLNDNEADDDNAAFDNDTDNRNSSQKNDKTYDYDSSFDDNTSKLIEEEVENFNISTESSLRSVHENEIETRLIRLDAGLKELSRSFEKIPAELKSPELLSPRSQSRSSSEEKEMIKSESSIGITESVTSSDDRSTEQERIQSPILMRNKNINEAFPNSAQPVVTMPDIISEAEVLRRQNIQILDNEKPVTPPFLYLREIPNKPPPPYVPPAHGSQFTSVFPTEDRINEIVIRRTKELYDIEFHHQKEPENSIIHENITNVYERIILDVCRESIHDFKVPKSTKTYEKIESFHKNQLSLYNPPNRLVTIQGQILKKIRRLLYVESQGIRPQTYTFVQGTNKRKRDLVDEILSHELNEEELKWTNFDLEEMEVKNKVTNEIVQMLIEEALTDFEEIYEK